MKKLKYLLSAILIFQLLACANPERVRASSDYNVCRLVILQPPLAPRENMQEAERQIRLRNLDCSRYAGAIIQQDINATNALIQLNQMNQQQQQIRNPIQTTCVRNGVFTNCTSY